MVLAEIVYIKIVVREVSLDPKKVVRGVLRRSESLFGENVKINKQSHRRMKNHEFRHKQTIPMVLFHGIYRTNFFLYLNRRVLRPLICRF